MRPFHGVVRVQLGTVCAISTSLQIPELTLFSNTTGISAHEFTTALVHQGPMRGQ